MKKTNTILDRIIDKKSKEVNKRKNIFSIEKIKSLLSRQKLNNISFRNALTNKNRISLIAELKKASPSLGLIKKDFDPVEIGKVYMNSGASAISILTEKNYFQGDIKFIENVKRTISLPILRKDFIIDPYEIYESKLYGADAVLLIVSLFSEPELRKMVELSKNLEIDCLVETHSYHELELAINCNADIIGINNRNLKTLEVDINHFLNLSRFVPENKILVCESGIFSRSDVLKVKLAGADAILVGTSLMTCKNIEKKVMELVI